MLIGDNVRLAAAVGVCHDKRVERAINKNLGQYDFGPGSAFAIIILENDTLQSVVLASAITLSGLAYKNKHPKMLRTPHASGF
jgi:hypothetical protein